MVHLPIFLAQENRTKTHKNVPKVLKSLNVANAMSIACVAGRRRGGKGSK